MNRLCLLLSLSAATVAVAQPRDRDERGGRREESRIIVYQEAGFRGDARVLFPGESIENMSGQTFDNGSRLNDRISSIRIEGDAEVYAYENAGFRGEALRLTESARDLSGRLVPGSVSVNWNDRISSLRVERARGRDSARPGAEPRGNPEKIIRQIFNDVLGREADGAELRLFRARFTDEGWTEKMLREHLRREERYRSEVADRIIRLAYREVLDREVDPAGLKQYRWALLEKEWTEGDVRDDLRRSEEFRKKTGRR
ncbi:MAG: hypothetical protein PSW75_06725 [bacterium]|nr:hypothetical protein [bacterium]MDI1337139.1 hypothetical protein [Lacunisphaera sp.]